MPDDMIAPDEITLTASAAKRIDELRRMEGNSGLMLRLAVSGGGCSGFSYNFSLDGSRQDEDRLFVQHGVGVLVDETSLGLLGGSVIDYVEDLVGSAFAVKNPNASSTCGCGSSFSV